MPLHLLFPLASSIVFVFGILFAKQAIVAGASPWTNTFLANAWLALAWGLIGTTQGDLLWTVSYWRAALLGIAFVAGQLFTYLAFRYGDVSVATPIFGVKVVIVAFLLPLLASESVGPRVWISAVLATVGVAVVQTGTRAPGHGERTTGHAALTVVLALLAALALSLFDVGLQVWSPKSNAISFVTWVFFFTGLSSCGFLPWIDSPGRLKQLSAFRPMVIGSILIALQAMSMSYALGRFGDAARINIVYALRGLWAVALAWLLARVFGGAERGHSLRVMLLRALGAVLLTIAVIIAMLGRSTGP